MELWRERQSIVTQLTEEEKRKAEEEAASQAAAEANAAERAAGEESTQAPTNPTMVDSNPRRQGPPSKTNFKSPLK